MQVTLDTVTTIWLHCQHAGQCSQCHPATLPSTCYSSWPLAASPDTRPAPCHYMPFIPPAIPAPIAHLHQWRHNMRASLINVFTITIRRHLSLFLNVEEQNLLELPSRISWRMIRNQCDFSYLPSFPIQFFYRRLSATCVRYETKLNSTEGWIKNKNKIDKHTTQSTKGYK